MKAVCMIQTKQMRIHRLKFKGKVLLMRAFRFVFDIKQDVV